MAQRRTSRGLTGRINREEVECELARKDLLHFIKRTFPRYQAGCFHEDVCARLEQFFADVEAKKSPRLMLFAPPRHGKSEIVSRRFPAWAYGRNPDLAMIATSYSAPLASKMNRDTQRIMRDDSYKRIFPDSLIPARGVASDGAVGNSEQFEIIGHRGTYRSAGVGGGITGMGADILIIDDPVKDAAEAESQTIRDGVWDWYLSTAYTRLEPGGGVLLIMTRWHTDDLAGRLLNQMETGEGDTWEVVRYPAIAEEDAPHRRKGEALHPDRFPLDRLKAIRKAVGSRVWEALYQQHPVNKSGGLFQRHWFEFVDAVPAGARFVRFWDRAATDEDSDGDPDYTVGVLMAKDRDGVYYIVDVRRFRLSPLGVLKGITTTATQDGHSVLIGLEQEPGASGKSEVQYLVRMLSGFIVKVNAPSVSKILRAGPVSAQAEVGNIKLVRGAWNEAFLSELESFPFGAHDDQVDGTSGAFFTLEENPYTMCTDW